MSVIELKSVSEMNDALAANTNVIVDFAAPAWCVPCQRFAPHYEAVAGNRDDVAFFHVDIDTADKELVDSYEVQSVPTVLTFKDGEFLGRVEKQHHTAPKLTKHLDTLFKE